MARVLIVDDDETIADLVATLLTTEGYDVVAAPHGQAALDVLRKSPPGLILLDMRMPVMDGWAFAEELRRRYGQRTPIVVCTAAEDAQRRAREVEAVGCLSKPFELDELLRLVGSVLPRRWEQTGQGQHP